MDKSRWTLRSLRLSMLRSVEHIVGCVEHRGHAYCICEIRLKNSPPLH